MSIFSLKFFRDEGVRKGLLMGFNLGNNVRKGGEIFRNPGQFSFSSNVKVKRGENQKGGEKCLD